MEEMKFQIEEALRGKRRNVDSLLLFDELSPVRNSVNTTLQRLRELKRDENDIDPNEIESDEEAAKIFSIESLAGLAKSNPVMAASFAVLIFSSAGIPPLAGFFSKFYVIYSAIGYGYLAFAIAAVIFSVISAYYYLRVIKIMYFDENKNAIALKESFGGKFVVILSALANLILILFADNLLNIIKDISIFSS
jgi:NADH:ubiquinone oxidoreductase subunit 2 (subunit N)